MNKLKNKYVNYKNRTNSVIYKMLFITFSCNKKNV